MSKLSQNTLADVKVLIDEEKHVSTRTPINSLHRVHKYSKKKRQHFLHKESFFCSTPSVVPTDFLRIFGGGTPKSRSEI